VCALPATQHWSHTYIHSLGYKNPSYELETEICSPRCGTLRSFPTQFPILPNPNPHEATTHQKQNPLYVIASLVLILQIFKLTYHRAALLYCYPDLCHVLIVYWLKPNNPACTPILYPMLRHKHSSWLLSILVIITNSSVLYPILSTLLQPP
jgi:hypothetical protein